MRDKENTPENSSSGLNYLMPWRVFTVRPLDNYCLEVTFLDGTCGEVDMSKLIFSQDAGVSEILRNVHVFTQVYVEHGVVTWPGEVDLAPDAMYREIKKQHKWIIE
jgi:hypothetical protein